MTSFHRHSFSGAASSFKRALASVVSLAVFISVLALLLIAVAACGDDDAGDSTSPTSSPSASGSGDGNGDGRETQTPGVGVSQRPDVTGSGTATIDGVQYDFAVSTCAIGPQLVFVIGFGTDPDGQPFVGTATWNELDAISGVPNAIEVGIGANASSLIDVGDKVYKLGSAVLGSTIESLEMDAKAFDLTTSGMFVDLVAPEAPAVPGTFSVSCR